MITTNDIKARQDSLFVVGAIHNPVQDILIIGSCRAVPYLNYLHVYNEGAGRPFRITFINPNDHHTSPDNQPRDLSRELKRLESCPRVAEAIRRTDIFIHEHHAKFGLFNTSRIEHKNIYQFGMRAHVDVSIPNFHNHFILLNDLIAHENGFAENFKAENVKMDMGSLSGLYFDDANHPARRLMQRVADANLGKFYWNCRHSSFPEFITFFDQNWRTKRLFYTMNHVAKDFTLEIFRRMNEQFLKLPLTEAFWAEVEKQDLFANPRTTPTVYDRSAFGLTWDEPYENISI